MNHLPCAACGTEPSENAHVRARYPRGRGTWEDIIPLCHLCHRRQHTEGRWTFAERVGLDYELALKTTREGWRKYAEDHGISEEPGLDH